MAEKAGRRKARTLASALTTAIMERSKMAVQTHSTSTSRIISAPGASPRGIIASLTLPKSGLRLAGTSGNVMHHGRRVDSELLRNVVVLLAKRLRVFDLVWLKDANAADSGRVLPGR